MTLVILACMKLRLWDILDLLRRNHIISCKMSQKCLANDLPKRKKREIRICKTSAAKLTFCPLLKFFFALLLSEN